MAVYVHVALALRLKIKIMGESSLVFTDICVGIYVTLRHWRMHRVARVVHGPPWDFDPAHIPYRILAKKKPSISPVREATASGRPRSLQSPGTPPDASPPPLSPLAALGSSPPGLSALPSSHLAAATRSPVAVSHSPIPTSPNPRGRAGT